MKQARQEEIVGLSIDGGMVITQLVDERGLSVRLACNVFVCVFVCLSKAISGDRVCMYVDMKL